MFGAPPCTPRQVGSEKGSIALEEKIAARRRLVFDPAHHESQGCEEQVFHLEAGPAGLVPLLQMLGPDSREREEDARAEQSAQESRRDEDARDQEDQAKG